MQVNFNQETYIFDKEKKTNKEETQNTKDFRNYFFCKEDKQTKEAEKNSEISRQIIDPIANLADKETGIYVHKGVVFQVDNKYKNIMLGNMAKGQKILSIPLSTGYTLKVNWNNIDELASCLDIFLPEDVNRIINAIAIQSRIDQIETGKSILKSMETNVKNKEKERVQKKEKELEEIKKKLQESNLTALELKKLAAIKADSDNIEKRNQLMALMGIF